MIVVSVARRPPEGTIAGNALKHGCGGLNIDATRIAGPAWRWGTQTDIRGGGYGTRRPSEGDVLARNVESNPSGRWPANIILSHLPGCKQKGIKDVKCGPWGKGKSNSLSKGQVALAQSSSTRPIDNAQFRNSDGTETVEAWECVEGCPVAALDGQSKNSHIAGNKKPTQIGVYETRCYGEWKSLVRNPDYYSDEGGASRFFKAVQEKNMTKIPKDLIEYLITLISPPDEKAVYLPSLKDIKFKEVPDASICGILVRGQPTEEQSKELLRVLKPGAHLLLIAPDEEPTGHTGACRVEDAGFEIRDSILWIREPGHFHYVAKAARAEREAGCSQLEGKSGAEAVDREEGTAGTQSPRAGAGRTAEKVKNFHPTVKPIELMERLLADVPKDKGPILDPFMGSGTTGVACLRTGHDFIGIEREAEYLEIADARIRHWDMATFGAQISRKIESDHKPKATDDQPQSLDDLFGFGGD